MLIQDKVSWDGDIDRRLGLLKTLGVDCVSMDIPDGPRADGAIDLSTPDSAAAFFGKAKATVAAHGMDLRTVLATSGFDEIKRGMPGRDEKIAWLLNAAHGMGAAGIPILAYNFKLLNSKLLRSAPAKGRGEATYISFDYDEYLKKPAPPIAPPLSEDRMRDNICVFSESGDPRRREGRRAARAPSRRPAGPARDACARGSGAYRLHLRGLPQDIRHRSVALERHAVLPGLRDRDEGCQRLRRHPPDGFHRQDRDGPLPQRAWRVPEVPGDFRRRGGRRHVPRHAGLSRRRVQGAVLARSFAHVSRGGDREHGVHGGLHAEALIQAVYR